MRFVLLVMCACLMLSACSSTYQGPVSDHFDGKVFKNPGPPKSSSVAGYLWLRLTSSQGAWPDAVSMPTEPPPPARVDDGSARITYIGHATLLIQIAGLNILTDPVWAQRASPFAFAGPKRVTQPSIALAALPPIDVVLISHDHYDHLDTQALKEIDQLHRPRVIVPLGNAALVQSVMPGSQVTEHDWGASVIVGKGNNARIHIEPMLHGSGRTPFNQMSTLWAAYVIESTKFKIYHVGDAGYGDGSIYRAAAQKHQGFDLAILPIGAYEPTSFMAYSHMRPSDALKAMQDSRAKRAMAHHFETFQLGFESFEAPRAELELALKQSNMKPEAFAIPKPGQHVVVQPGL